MATTTRVRRKKEPAIETKVQEVAEQIKEVEPQQQVEDKKHLSFYDILQLEGTQKDLENARLKIAIEEQFLKNLSLEFKMMETRIEKQKTLIAFKTKEHENLKHKYAAIKEEIWQRYGLSDQEGLGYNPLTGEIVKD